MRATMYDVAKKAGVSVATVSHVISEKRYVSPELKVRVDEAIVALNYIPSRTAQSLKYRQTSLIGLIIPDILNPFFAEIARSVERVAFSKGFYVLLFDTAGDPQREKKMFRILIQHDPVGIIAVAPRISGDDLQYYSEYTKVVIIDRPLDQTEGRLGSVFFDNYQGSAAIAKFFLDCGHRHFACIMGPKKTVPNVLFRVNGFVDTLVAQGVAPQDICVKYGEFNYPSGHELTMNLLASDPRPTALFAGNDTMAWGAMEACKSLHVAVPQTISIAGFDDVYFSSLLNPQLTTVTVPRVRAGELGIEMLLRMVDSGSLPTAESRVVLPCTLRVRDSVSRPENDYFSKGVDKD